MALVALAAQIAAYHASRRIAFMSLSGAERYYTSGEVIKPEHMALARWHSAMYRKYEAAAQCAWLPVWPDPPPPEP
jgi:hypothetical protein